MPKSLDIFDLLRRGGEMTDAEVKQLTREWTEAQVANFSKSITNRTVDQPVKVVPMRDLVPSHVSGYFTLEKFLFGKNPQDMGRVLGAFGKFLNGAYIMKFVGPLQEGDFVSRAYTYLPDGKPYRPNPK